ncbi:MAG: hypothetical protein ACI83N_001216 [Hydrogenophaga sp.]|jgi:hypothetical protein
MATIHNLLSSASSFHGCDRFHWLRGRPHRRLTGLLGAGLLMAVSLAACGQPRVSVPRCDSVVPAGTTQRVLVSFREATVADAPAVTEKLQTLAGACVWPVSSVSPTLHVYAVNTTVDVDEIRARLLRWRAVTAVETDVRVRRH